MTSPWFSAIPKIRPCRCLRVPSSSQCFSHLCPELLEAQTSEPDTSNQGKTVI
ncbi:MAG: hypothetical protein O4750_06825 [Trichodesmium sp. St18_bin3_1_1]|nr:hypothetical protein [Trichodesmium sp. St4_bin8_1]MDE5072742.1 hypothetical protein [Trichodesmium sp. St5_bin8]MDE5091478.1 hypothetical protein [Trichodesmium sp. St18_bin3_1_1]